MTSLPDESTILSKEAFGSVDARGRASCIETARLTISSPSAGITLGGTLSQDVVISNNNASFLTKVGSASTATPAEVPAFDAGSGRLVVAAGSVVNVYQVGSNGGLTALANLAPGFAVSAGKTALPHSVAINAGLVAVAYDLTDNVSGTHEPGRVAFFNAASGSFVNSVTVGAAPGGLVFTPLILTSGAPN